MAKTLGRVVRTMHGKQTFFARRTTGRTPAERIKTRKKQALQPLGIVKPAPNFADVQTELYERLPRKIRLASPAPIPETL